MIPKVNSNISILCALVLLAGSCQKKGQERSNSELSGGGPCDYLATAETRALYYNLKELAKTKVLFGHQDDLAYGVKWWDVPGRSDVKETSGSYPAVYGWEIGNIAGERNLDSVSFSKMKEWIREGYERGGVITISWHEHNPVTGGSAWDTSGRAVSHIIPGGSQHEAWKKKLDLVADFMLSLKGNDGELIPVVFRPYHELTGSWFWWGKDLCTPLEFIQLWQFTKDYLTSVKNVHNLLYAYSTDVFETEEYYFERYPGDKYVDVLGFDDYRTVSDQASAAKTINELHLIAGMAERLDKIPAWTETGLVSIPVENWWTETILKRIKTDTLTCRIAWVLVWRNARPDHHYAPYAGHPSAADFKKFRDDESILFEDELPELYK
jgi:mannan endo-1,4-beta-mannosidase